MRPSQYYFQKSGKGEEEKEKKRLRLSRRRRGYLADRLETKEEMTINGVRQKRRKNERARESRKRLLSVYRWTDALNGKLFQAPNLFRYWRSSHGEIRAL